MKKSTRTLFAVGLGAIGLVTVVALVAKSKSKASGSSQNSVNRGRGAITSGSNQNAIVALSGNSYTAGAR
jgi:hypothetical protein